MECQIIDFHTHVFPQNIAAKAVEHLANYYSLKISQSGLVDDLLRSAIAGNVDRLVVHSTATCPRQVEHVNTWIASISSDKIIGFGTIHPDFPNIRRELDRIKSLGLKGLKLHPEFQGFEIDEKRMLPIYEAIE